MTEGSQHSLIVFEGNWPGDASTDTKYWIRLEAGQYIVAARDRRDDRETWYPSTDAHARELRISSLRSVDSVLIQVKDTGHGLKPSHANSIFEPFFTTKKGGIGMGLKISRSIIEAHGGRMWAEAGTPDGAIVNLSLPIEAKS